MFAALFLLFVAGSLMLFAWACRAYLLMIGLDLASNLDGRVPDFGFWTCFWLVVTISFGLYIQSGTDKAASSTH